jgi:hypothetical protein
LKKPVTLLAVAAALSAIGASPASANHSWGTYHWGVTATPFTVGLDNNLTTTGWRALGASSSADWTRSTVLDAPLSGPKGDNKRCKASAGIGEVCNGKYGQNGWLGLAQIWLSGDHITQGTSKMNDTYLANTRYSDINRQHVLCQEVGHIFGLGHTSEDGSDQQTCMDYSSDLGNPSPNAHDDEQLNLIYNHTDPTTTLASSPSTGMAGRSDARPYRTTRADHRNHTEIVEQFADGSTRITDVLWADGARPSVDPG